MIHQALQTYNKTSMSWWMPFITRPNLERYVEKLSEAIQILHHAYTYQMDKVHLLVGNQQGDITSGVWVTFGDTLLSSYREYLQ
jgi:hypothetical protein